MIQKYKVFWTEITTWSTTIPANSEEEAIHRVQHGESNIDKPTQESVEDNENNWRAEPMGLPT